MESVEYLLKYSTHCKSIVVTQTSLSPLPPFAPLCLLKYMQERKQERRWTLRQMNRYYFDILCTVLYKMYGTAMMFNCLCDYLILSRFLPYFSECTNIVKW